MTRCVRTICPCRLNFYNNLNERRIKRNDYPVITMPLPNQKINKSTPGYVKYKKISKPEY